HALGVVFTGNQGKRIDTRTLDAAFIDLPAEPIVLKGTASTVIRGRIDLGNGSTMERALTFNADSYVIDAGFTMSNLDNVMPSTQRWFDIAWERGLQYQEANSVDESNGAVAFASMNDRWKSWMRRTTTNRFRPINPAKWISSVRRPNTSPWLS
ncbi:MAG: hypothetical protein ACKO9V_10100, partial [Candidatus Kapaibacterium sp.]